MFGVTIQKDNNIIMNLEVDGFNKTSNKQDDIFANVLEKQKTIMEKKIKQGEEQAKKASLKPTMQEKSLDDEKSDIDKKKIKWDEIVEILNSISQLLVQMEEIEFSKKDLETIKLKLDELAEILSNNLPNIEGVSLLKDSVSNIEQLKHLLTGVNEEINLAGKQIILEENTKLLSSQLKGLIENIMESTSNDTNNAYTQGDLQEKGIIKSNAYEEKLLVYSKSIESFNNREQNPIYIDKLAEKTNILDKQLFKEAEKAAENIESIAPSLHNGPFEMGVDRVDSFQEVTNYNNLNEAHEKELLQQIIDKMAINPNEYKQEVEIKLKPELLGKLLLKMELKDGVLNAKFVVDNYRTKELIETNLIYLKEHIEEIGLEIKTFEVFVGTNQEFESQQEKFNYNSDTNKKQKLKDNLLEGVLAYDDNLSKSSVVGYHEGQLNLFA